MDRRFLALLRRTGNSGLSAVHEHAGRFHEVVHRDARDVVPQLRHEAVHAEVDVEVSTALGQAPGADDPGQLVATEFGDFNCTTGYVVSLLNYMDAPAGDTNRRMGWTGWAWNGPGSCGWTSIINDWNGTPSTMGQRRR